MLCGGWPSGVRLGRYLEGGDLACELVNRGHCGFRWFRETVWVWGEDGAVDDVEDKRSVSWNAGFAFEPRA